MSQEYYDPRKPGIHPVVLPDDEPPKPELETSGLGAGQFFTGINDPIHHGRRGGGWDEEPPTPGEHLEKVPQENARRFYNLWTTKLDPVLAEVVELNPIQGEKLIEGLFAIALYPAKITQDCKTYLVNVAATAVLLGRMPKDTITPSRLGINKTLAGLTGRRDKPEFIEPIGLFQESPQNHDIEEDLLIFCQANHHMINVQPDIKIASHNRDLFLADWKKQIEEKYE